MRIISLNIGKPQSITYKNKEFITGIGKKTVQRMVLKVDKIEGDGVANLEFHGGPDRAVCFYPYEHYKQWENEFSTKLSIPSFGENLTVSGMLEKNIFIGDIIQIGEAIVQITQGRIPCSTISKFNGLDSLLKRTVETCYTGYFARVLKEGNIDVDSKIILIDRHPLEISVFHTMHSYFHQNKAEVLQSIVEINELASAMKEKFLKKINKISK